MKRTSTVALISLVLLIIASCEGIEGSGTEIIKTPEAIDMGLSVKWASCNIGASRPEDFGDYYAWGETETKATYDWSTYTLCSGSKRTMTKYCTSMFYGTTDNKTTLEKADDVAAQELGGSWRMPTTIEWGELIHRCDWKWTTINGVEGMLVTSKKTDNSIFLPAANDVRGYVFDGVYGSYWSSSLSTLEACDARCCHFDRTYASEDEYRRFEGLSVRPVSE